MYQWTPTATGNAILSLCGTGTTFDTVLYVRTGSCSNGATVGCNDDACANASGKNVASQLSLPVTAGKTYFVIVDGYGQGKGNFRLTVTPPAGTMAGTLALTCPVSAPVGTDLVVPLTATVGSHPLGAYAVAVTYDPSILHVTAIQGATSGVFTSAPTSNSGDWASGTTRFNAYQATSLSGPTGTVPLARVTFHVVGGSGARPSIGLITRSLYDTGGVALSGTATGCP